MGFKFSQLKKTFGHVQKKEKKQKGSGKEFIAKLSKGLMLPIAMLPIAGLFLGIGSAIVSNAGNNEGLTIFGNFLSVPGNAIFGALPLLFAIAIAIAFTGDAGPAALAAFVGYLVFSALQSALATPVSVTDETGTTSVLGYNLLFYTPGSMGAYSPSADNYTVLGAQSSSGFTPGMSALDPNTASLVQSAGLTNIFVQKTGTASAGLPAALFGDVIGLNQLQSSVFGGFIVGFIVAALYNKFKNIQLPTVIGFFSGVRFIPIVTFAALFPVTIVFLMIWPLIGILLSIIGQGLGQAVGINSFIFGYVERALVPFGLHHAFYSPLWYTSAGGSINMTASAVIYYNDSFYAVNSTQGATTTESWNKLVQDLTGSVPGTANNPGTVAGDQTTWAYLNANLLGRDVYITKLSGVGAYDFTKGVYDGLNSATFVGNSIPHKLSWSDLTSGQQSLGTKGANGFLGVNVGQYLQGKYSFMIFGLPCAAAAMIMAAPKENRKVASSIVISAALTSALTGITEPIEYTFLFLSPVMFWVFHALMAAFCFGMMNWIGIIATVCGRPDLAPHIGMSFSGGIIDWVIYGGIQIPNGSNAWWALLLGIAIAPVYYFVFLWAIKKFDIKTPGRGETTKLFTKADYQAKINAAHSSGAIDLNQGKLLALNVIKAYGGFDNIKNVDACITKLRVQVGNQDAVDTQTLMNLGAKGTIKPSPQSLYAVFGGEADIIKNNMKDIINDIANDPSKRKYYEDVINGNDSSNEQSATSAETPKTSDEKIIIKSPVTGKIVPMNKVPDETFSQNLMGVGVAIEPTNGNLVSPIDGKLSLVFETGHAYSFESEKGTQVLVHVGIDSINLKDSNGQPVNPFTPAVATGDAIKAGASIATVDLTKLKLAKSRVIPIIVLNESLFGRTVKVLKNFGDVRKGDPILEVSLPKQPAQKPASSSASKEPVKKPASADKKTSSTSKSSTAAKKAKK